MGAEKGAKKGVARRRVQLSFTCAGAAACAMLAAPLAAGGGVQLPSCASAAKVDSVARQSRSSASRQRSARSRAYGPRTLW